jgi:putative membrane protein
MADGFHRVKESTMMYWGNNGMSGGGYALMAASMVLFWGLVIAGIVLLVRYLSTNSSPASSPPPQPVAPEAVLADRFARGDIDDEEYRRRLDTLRDRGPDRAVQR